VISLRLFLRFNKIRMNLKERTKIIKQAEKRTTLLRSDDYIEAQLTRDGLKDLTLQMGSNCNLSCFHCYGNYGPRRKGLPKPRIIKKCLEEAVDISLKRVCLTDGEPFRYQNRKVMGLIAQFSKYLPVNIITNGSFARTKGNTLDWFNFLKDSGFNLAQKGNNLEVSCGIMYDINLNNYFRIHSALTEIFPDADFSAHFSYRGVFVPDELEGGYENIKKLF